MSNLQFTVQGYTLIPDAVSPADCDALTQHVAAMGVQSAGSRNLLLLPWCMQLAAALKVHAAIAALLPTAAAAVQCTLFEKSAQKNWAVAIHQDLSIPVRERVDAPACSGWALKEGVLHTQPPPDVLATLVVVRVHLDACPPQAGPLRVVPGSHQRGRLSPGNIERLREQHGEVECTAARGEALVMRPLLLHASSRMAGADVRRVLHFVFGPLVLPHGLHWPVVARAA